MLRGVRVWAMLRLSTALVVAFLPLCAAPRAAHAEPCPVDEAVTRARAAAFDDRDPAAGLAATTTYLDALNRLGPKQPGCYATIEYDAPKLRDLYCRVSSRQRETDACVLLDKIQVDILRLAAQRIVEAADKTGGEAAKALHVEGGNRYLDAYRTSCEEPVKDGRPLHVSDSTCEELAYNAARSFGAAHLAAKSIVAYRLIVADDARTKRGSPLAARAMYDLASAYRSMALFEEAAEWLERFATLRPAADKAPAALSDAALLRMGLGQDAQAASDVATFTKTWGITRRAEGAQLALTVATHHAERGDKEKARAVLSGAMPMLDRGPPDLTVRAHALAATLAVSPAIATLEWAKVRAAWTEPVAAERALRRGWPGDDEMQSDRRLARALNAVGEAMFALAEDRRHADVEPLKLALYTGPADRASLAAYGNTTMRDWLAKKRSAIEQAEAEYRKVLELRPVPPPLWVVAASASVGAMWGDLVDDVRRMPIPIALRTDRALRRAYLDALESATEPLDKGKARPAMRACLAFAAKYAVLDPRARRCDVWLARHDPSEHHLVDEIVPSFRTPAVVDGPRTFSPLLAPFPDEER